MISDVLHVICTRLRLGQLSVRVGDGSRRSEEIVKKKKKKKKIRIAPFNEIIIIIAVPSKKKKKVLQWLPCQASNVIGSAPGLVGPVSVYCDWVRQ